MVSPPQLNAEGLPVGSPPMAQIDSIPSRLAQAQGVQTGMMTAANGAVTSALLPAQTTALAISDQVQTAIEQALTPAAQVMFGIVNQAITSIEQVLAPLIQDFQANLPKKKKSGTCAGTTAGATGPGLSPPPAPPPLGCYWLMPPPGSGQPNLLTCSNPYPAEPFGEQVPTVIHSPPVRQATTTTAGTMVIYTVYVNCNDNLLAGVPNNTGTLARQLKAEGWLPVFPPGAIEAQSPADAAALLQSLALTIAPMCPTAA